MRHLVRNLTVWAVDVAASLALVILDACSWPTVDQPPAEPTPPTVPDMPRQRDISVDEEALDLAMRDAVLVLARLQGLAPMPVALVAEVVELERLMQAPSAEVAND